VKEERGAIAFAEKVLELLDEGRYTATYKYAVLLALIDLCLERTQASGAPPEVVTTRELAEKIVEIYWPHTAPFGQHVSQASVLHQTTVGQAEIVSAIAGFRAQHAPEAATNWQGRLAAPKRYEAVVRSVEWKLIEMPLPRLQKMGVASVDFIYEIKWNEAIAKATIDRYVKGDTAAFDDRIYLKSGVGEYLLQLNGLLRPLIHRRWAAMVAMLNQLEDSRLEEFLFGADRVPTVTVRPGLWEIQGKRCFYCADRVADPSQVRVDHFIPWARYPDNGIENLVVADATCNGYKGSSLAAGEHVTRWAARHAPGAPTVSQLADLAAGTGWDRHAERTFSVARGIYLGLPQSARLWLRAKNFVAVDPDAVRQALVHGALAG
jgi:hypothetical protein